jgi:hypothetical protein
MTYILILITLMFFINFIFDTNFVLSVKAYTIVISILESIRNERYFQQ